MQLHTGRLLVVNRFRMRQTLAVPSKAKQGCRAALWQVRTRFRKQRQDTTECLLNVKGSQVQSCQPDTSASEETAGQRGPRRLPRGLFSASSHTLHLGRALTAAITPLRKLSRASVLPM